MTCVSKKQLDIGAMNRLVVDLYDKPQSSIRKKIITRALKLEYSTYSSKLEFPSFALEFDLELAGYDDLIGNLYNGKYDS
jgi:hypothetical protein